MTDELYSIEWRRSGYATFIGVIGKRNGIEVFGTEKVIPPIIIFSRDGSFRVASPEEVLRSVKMHPYRPGTGDFSPERLADLEVSSFYSQLEHFPSLPSIVVGDKSCPHPVAEFLYSNMAYLKPSDSLCEEINSAQFVERGKIHSEAIENTYYKLKKEAGFILDLFSLPKKAVGTFSYIADEDGYSSIAKAFSFGFHKAFPCDRIVREASSLKNCEMFMNPESPPCNVHNQLKRFVTLLRVAVVGTDLPMLDSGDLMRSGVKKLSALMIKRTVIKDIESIKNQNLRYVSSRGGVEVVHIDEERIDESTELPGTIRLVLPGGIKIAAQCHGEQGFSSGKPIDLLLDFRTVSDKGAVALFAMMNPENYGKNLSREDAVDFFKSLKREEVEVEGSRFKGYVGEIPVMRPGQRYSDLAKASSKITVDLVSKAILRKEFKVKKKTEDLFQDLKAYREALKREMDSLPEVPIDVLQGER